jgi:hypothetical protein
LGFSFHLLDTAEGTIKQGKITESSAFKLIYLRAVSLKAQGLMPDRPICFVIAPIGKDATETRLRSDKVLKHIIGPVAEECGYEAIRADKISEPGMITTQVINHILNDAMVVGWR